MGEHSLDLSALRNALGSLEGAIDVVSDSGWFDRQPANVRNTLIAGVVRNFEFVYEIGIKMMRRQIEIDAASPAGVDGIGFKDMLRIAGEAGLVADVEAWFRYRRMRNLTSHTYDRDKAREVYQNTLTFVVDARALLASLEARNG